MTFSFDLESWLKVTAHPLVKRIILVKYKSDWAKGREDILRTRDLRRTDVLIAIGRPQSGVLIKTDIEQSGLDIAKMYGLSTDGARVMVGRNIGVTAESREYSNKLIKIYCVCRRLALICNDSCNSVECIKYAEKLLIQSW